MTAGGREFQVAGAAQLKDRLPISVRHHQQQLWLLFHLFTALFARYCTLFNCIQLFGYPAASVFNKLNQTAVTASTMSLQH